MTIEDKYISDDSDETSSEISENDSEDRDPEDEDGKPSLEDIYGYEDPDGNTEAALDDILKIQENGG